MNSIFSNGLYFNTIKVNKEIQLIINDITLQIKQLDL